MTSFAPEALYRDATGKTMIVDPGAFTRPGGAYEDGAFGPEQILCSESNLYPILVAHKRDFYDKNRDYRRGSLFTDRALYVPEVLFSRGGDVRRADVLVIAEAIRAYALENPPAPAQVRQGAGRPHRDHLPRRRGPALRRSS